MPAKHIPEGYHTVVPYIIARDAEELLTSSRRDRMPLRKTSCATPRPNLAWRCPHRRSHVMFSQATERHPAMACSLYLYVPDTDVAYRAALAAGATSVMEPANQFDGDRNAGVKDANGTSGLRNARRSVSPEEMGRRQADEVKKRQQAHSPTADVGATSGGLSPTSTHG